MHEVSRRAVLGAGAAVAGLAVTATSASPAAAAAPASARLMRRSHYAKLVGRQFLAVDGTERRRIRLVAITSSPHITRARQQDSFTLVFVPVDGRQLDDGIYRLHRAGTQTSELFLSGVGGGISVQAVINRITAT